MNAERIRTTVLNNAPIPWGLMSAAVVLDIGWLPIDTRAMVILIISGDHDKAKPLRFITQISMSVVRIQMGVVRIAAT